MIGNLEFVPKIVRLTEQTDIKPFDCGNEELNIFLLEESKMYLRQKLANTFILENENEIIGYFCLLNDSIRRDINLQTWNKINRKVPNQKRKGAYPAVKIGRLAVSAKYAQSGFGSMMIDIVKMFCINNNNNSACRFITVDSFGVSTKFYEKNGFNYFSNADEKKETRLMYFDLIQN